MYLALNKCASKEGSKSSDSSIQPITTTNFTSPEDASKKLSGTANSILTARILTARMGTTDGGTNTGSGMSGAPLAHEILLSPHLKKYTKRLNLKHSDEGNTCEIPTKCDETELLPECESGTAKLESCKIETNKITYTISTNSCKESEPDDPNTYFIYSGRGTFTQECKEYSFAGTSTLLSQFSVALENVKIDIYQQNQKIYEYEFSPNFSISLNSSVEYKNNILSVIINIVSSGSAREKDVKGNIEQRSNFDNFKISLSLEYQEGTTEPGFSISLSGKYSYNTSTQWCGDGGFEVSTIEPLKFTDARCPNQGKLKLNNAEIRFEGNNIKISVDGKEESLKCEEFLNSCPYPLKGAFNAVPGT